METLYNKFEAFYNAKKFSNRPGSMIHHFQVTGGFVRWSDGWTAIKIPQKLVFGDDIFPDNKEYFFSLLDWKNAKMSKAIAFKFAENASTLTGVMSTGVATSIKTCEKQGWPRDFDAIWPAKNKRQPCGVVGLKALQMKQILSFTSWDNFAFLIAKESQDSAYPGQASFMYVVNPERWSYSPEEKTIVIATAETVNNVNNSPWGRQSVLADGTVVDATDKSQIVLNGKERYKVGQTYEFRLIREKIWDAGVLVGVNYCGESEDGLNNKVRFVAEIDGMEQEFNFIRPIE